MLTDFTPNWAFFLFFVISHDRRLEHGWNWILWPSNLMLTDFMPNWALFLFSLFHIITWIKLNSMTYEFNVDRFYAQLGAFSIFVHSHDRGMKPGSNWISWPVNLMLTDFTPNWALFLFSLFHMKEGPKCQKSGRVCVISMTQRCLVSSFFCQHFKWPSLINK